MIDTVESTIKINFRNYLGEDEIKKIAEDELRRSIRDQIKKESDMERILANIGYHLVFEIVKEELNVNEEEFRAVIKKRCAEILDPKNENTLAYTVFRRKDAWGTEESPAVKYLDEALAESKPKIVEIVNKRIEEYPFNELRENILDTIYQCIEQMLIGRNGNERTD